METTTAQVTSLLDIANALKAMGARGSNSPVWERSSETPAWTGVSAPIKTNPVVNNGKAVNLYSLDLGEKAPVRFIRLGKDVPANKQSYDIYLYKAVRDFPETEKEKARFKDVDPIKKGNILAMAH